MNQRTTQNILNQGVWCPYSGQGNKGHIYGFYDTLYDTIYDEAFLQQLGVNTREKLKNRRCTRNRPAADQVFSNIPAEESKGHIYRGQIPVHKNAGAKNWSLGF